MAVVHSILGTFLGVVCHCFPTFAARCLHVRNDARDPSPERWKYGRESLSGNFAYIASLFTQIYDMGPTASTGLETANLGTKGQHANP
jgi:hypothetical protein